MSDIQGVRTGISKVAIGDEWAATFGAGIRRVFVQRVTWNTFRRDYIIEGVDGDGAPARLALASLTARYKRVKEGGGR